MFLQFFSTNHKLPHLITRDLDLKYRCWRAAYSKASPSFTVTNCKLEGSILVVTYTADKELPMLTDNTYVTYVSIIKPEGIIVVYEAKLVIEHIPDYGPVVLTLERKDGVIENHVFESVKPVEALHFVVHKLEAVDEHGETFEIIYSY